MLPYKIVYFCKVATPAISSSISWRINEIVYFSPFMILRLITYATVTGLVVKGWHIDDSGGEDFGGLKSPKAQ